MRLPEALHLKRAVHSQLFGYSYSSEPVVDENLKHVHKIRQKLENSKRAKRG